LEAKVVTYTCFTTPVSRAETFAPNSKFLTKELFDKPVYTLSNTFILSADEPGLKVIITICLKRFEDELLVCAFVLFVNKRIVAVNIERVKSIFFISRRFRNGKLLIILLIL